MRWLQSWRADPRARVIADRHYNRQKIGARQFVPPGRCVVLLIPGAALWITSWPFAEYAGHAWAGAWMCSAFRNESPERFRSSELILEAVAATRAAFGEPPPLGMVTFVDERAVRRKRDAGRCYRKAGFKVCGRTKEQNLLALQLLPHEMPEPREALREQMGLLA